MIRGYVQTMKTIAIASQKGGAGKSTLCLHLSVLAAQTGAALVVDLDPQGSVSFWHSRRASETPLLIQGDAKDLHIYLQAAKAEGVKTVLIDTAPHDSASMATAMRLADIVLIPARPSALDLHAVEATLKMVGAIKRPAYVVLSQCPPKRGFSDPASVTEARAVVESLGGTTAPVEISHRVIAAQSIIAGQAVQEIEPGGASAQEFAALWQWIKRELNNGQKT